MKQLTEYNRVSGYLNKVFDLLNARYFENTLSKPIITIQSIPKAYGHVTVKEVWESGDSHRRELNLGAGTLNKPIDFIVAVMIHEMVHIYCLQNGIKDTSRGNAYHNKRFKEEAEKRGLHCEHSNVHGWTHTSPTDEIVQFCCDNNLSEILIRRIEILPFGLTPPSGGTSSKSPEKAPKKPTSTRKYQCPKCKCSCRATKDINIICADCNIPYKKV